ncbi:MAG: hypothetical protein M0Q88_00925 [Bacilli bacterium]|nr:hypothetical protein [Bacilli bacterium]
MPNNFLSNFTETEFPDNRPPVPEDEQDSITIGATCTHIFDLPFLSADIEEAEIIYRQGLNVVLNKQTINNDFAIEDNLDPGHEGSRIVLTLSPEDTLKFKPNLLDVYVQLKIIKVKPEAEPESVDNVLYNTPIKLKLNITLDNLSEVN